MNDTNKHLEDLACFIREHRSDAANFGKLYEKLIAEQQSVQSNPSHSVKNYSNNLSQALKKYGALYKQHKEKDIGSWTEFENFVSHFEKAVLEELHASD